MLGLISLDTGCHCVDFVAGIARIEFIALRTRTRLVLDPRAESLWDIRHSLRQLQQGAAFAHTGSAERRYRGGQAGRAEKGIARKVVLNKTPHSAGMYMRVTHIMLERTT